MNLNNITLVTGNQDKLSYAKTFLDFPILHKDIDLQEIQHIDPLEVIRHKTIEAFNIIKAPVMVEDASLVFSALKTLPGPFIKWFYKELGNQGLCDMLNGYSDRSAQASVIFGLFDGRETLFFESSLQGHISINPGKEGVGYNPIFIPEGYDRPLSEICPQELQIRKQAFENMNLHFKTNNL